MRIQDLGQVSQILHFQIQTLVQKLSFEGWGVQEHVQDFGLVSQILHDTSKNELEETHTV